ncbi:hypothetical protein ACHAXS_002044 [Conticribra weissflogii]
MPPDTLPPTEGSSSRMLWICTRDAREFASDGPLHVHRGGGDGECGGVRMNGMWGRWLRDGVGLFGTSLDFRRCPQRHDHRQGMFVGSYPDAKGVSQSGESGISKERAMDFGVVVSRFLVGEEGAQVDEAEELLNGCFAE